MKKRLRILNYAIIIITLILYFLTIFNSNLNISYITSLIIFILLSSLTFICGIIIDERKVYKNNLNIYIFLYFILLFSLTMFIERSGVVLVNKEYFKSYIKYINIVPFRTIFRYLSGNSSIMNIIYNIFGNLIALMPLSLLLMLKNEKNKKISWQFLKISIIVLIIEFLQFIFACGRFDIDDFILNVGGALLFCYFILKTNLLPKFSKIFTTDLSIKKLFKNFVFIIIIFIIILMNILVIFELVESKKYVINKKIETFITVPKEQCNGLEVYKADNYNIYLNCIDVIYEKDNYQFDINEIISKKILNKNTIEKSADEKDVLKDGEVTVYKSSEKDITFILCNTSDGNKDIYIGNYSLQYDQNYCKN